jgi:hypothetical protein
MIPKRGNRFSEKDHAPAIEHDPEKGIPIFGKDSCFGYSAVPER